MLLLSWQKLQHFEIAALFVKTSLNFKAFEIDLILTRPFERYFVEANRRDIRRLGRELELALVQDAGAFWQKRYRFETLIDKPGARSESILIGKDRARDIVVNIFIPALCLYSEEAQEGRLRNTILELYRRYSKLSDNSITKTMVRQLFNEAPRLKCALQQQGLIQLHKVYCRPLKCSECLGLA